MILLPECDGLMTDATLQGPLRHRSQQKSTQSLRIGLELALLVSLSIAKAGADF